MIPLDRTRPVREGEQLDVAALGPYLAQTLGLTAEPVVEQFPGGHSNLTYLIRAGDTELVLRRPPFGTKVKSAHDMGREHRILERLHAVYPPAPKPLVYCDDLEILGAPFYLMERIVGIILRKNPPAELGLSPAICKRLGESFVDNLADLHAIDYAAAGLGELGKPEGYIERQVRGWSERYQNAKTDDIADMDFISTWLAERTPRESGAALIHNDYKYDNIVLDADDLTRIVGVLDWEMSTVGDPLMDLGTALGYWVQADDTPELQMIRFCATTLPGSLTRQQLVERYSARTGRDIRDMLFYYCFALFKTAGVAQQIYYRYQQGLTKDERFAAMIGGVRVLAATAVAAAQSGRF